MAKMSGGRALVRSVIRHGVDTMFVLPGVQMDHFFNAVHDEGNRLAVLQTRHEQGAAYMALGYAQATGRPGVYAVVPGPGFLNTTAALSTAYAAGSPVLALSGQIPAAAEGRHMGLLHEIPDQLSVMKGLTKYAERIEHPADAPAKVARAFQEMSSGYIRPAGLETPMDVLAAETEVSLLDPLPPLAPPPVDGDLVEAAAKLLGAAENPLIIIGGGAGEAGEALLAVAEMLQAPVVSARTGRGIISDRHPLGHTGATGHDLWQTADVVLAVGTRLQQHRMNWGVNPERKIILVDIEPLAFHRIARPDLGIRGDAALVLADLAGRLPAHNRARADKTEEYIAMKAAKTEHLKTVLGPQLAYLEVLRNALGDDDIYVDELTQVSYPARIAFPVYSRRSFITTGYQGTLGYGFATALGAKVGAPDKRVLSVNGDGGFMYNVQELATAVQHNIPIVAVVFEDGAFGNVQRMQKNDHGGRVIATDLRNPDFMGLAKSFGANALSADSPETLATAIEEGFNAKAPTLIHVPVGQFPDPWPHIMPGMKL